MKLTFWFFFFLTEQCSLYYCFSDSSTDHWWTWPFGTTFVQFKYFIAFEWDTFSCVLTVLKHYGCITVYWPCGIYYYNILCFKLYLDVYCVKRAPLSQHAVMLTKKYSESDISRRVVLRMCHARFVVRQ